MSDWPWVTLDLVRHVHARQIERYGGLAGLRSPELLESAIGRPQMLAHYGEPDAFDLAASYAFGIARNHPFLDGNKRTAFVVCLLFLGQTGYALTAPAEERRDVFLRLAAGGVSEPELADWLRANTAALR